VSGALAGAAALALLGASGVLAAAALGVRRWTEFALAVYVIAFGEVVALSLGLSLFGALTRGALLVGLAALLVAIAVVWGRAGSPRPPALPSGLLASLRGPLLALTGVAALAVGYLAVLNAATAPNGWDQLNYHLPRAAFWLQSERVGYIEAAYDNRLNFNPPNGEIAMAFWLGVTRYEVLTSFVQLAAGLACALGIAALSRRLGLDRREALFGALLFLTLPVILLQAGTTKNDLIVCAFLVAAAVFALGDSRGDLGLAALATALAVGTKFTGLYGVVLLGALVLLTQTRLSRWWRLAAIAGGALAGSFWFAVNAAETGDVLGDQSHTEGLTAILDPAANLFTVYGFALDAVDLSGAEGRDIWLYLLAAGVVAALLLAWRGRGRRALLEAGAAAALVASPLLFLELHTEIGRRGLYKVHQLLGQPDAFLAFEGSLAYSPATASAGDSWYGVTGLLLAVGVGIAAVVLVRRGRLPRVALLFAAAPVVWLLLLAASLTYHPFHGRFFAFPVALSAALWGLALRVRPVAWAAVGLAATTALVTLVHSLEKPSGLRLLDRTPTSSAWTMERWELQSAHAPGVGPLYRFFEKEVPPRDPVALALDADDFGYPVFGPRLERRVELVPFGSDAADIQARWLLASFDRVADIDRRCWRPVLEDDDGTIFRKVSPPAPGSARDPPCAPAG
jgi:hypothetical protein